MADAKPACARRAYSVEDDPGERRVGDDSRVRLVLSSARPHRVIPTGTVLVALLLWQTVALGAPPAIPLGRYAAVTESEWSLDLELKKNGRATLTVASWEPGQRKRSRVNT